MENGDSYRLYRVVLRGQRLDLILKAIYRMLTKIFFYINNKRKNGKKILRLKFKKYIVYLWEIRDSCFVYPLFGRFLRFWELNCEMWNGRWMEDKRNIIDWHVYKFKMPTDGNIRSYASCICYELIYPENIFSLFYGLVLANVLVENCNLEIRITSHYHANNTIFI